MSAIRCNYIHPNGIRCKKLVEPGQKYCWIHRDSHLTESLEQVEPISDLPTDIVQHVLNPYIDYLDESDLVENLTGLKLDISSHLKKESHILDLQKPDERIFFLSLFGLDKNSVIPEYFPTTESDITVQYCTVDNKLHGKMDVYNLKLDQGSDKKSDQDSDLNLDLKLVGTYNFSNGMLDGSQTVYNPDGIVKILKFSKNTQHGIQKYFYPNGRLGKAYHLKYGIIEGPYNIYSPDGILLERENYKDEKLNGIQKYYNESGILIEELNYKNGLQHGIQKYYNSDGSLFSELNYKNGYMDGIQKYYDSNGKLKSTKTYKNNKLISET